MNTTKDSTYLEVYYCPEIKNKATNEAVSGHLHIPEKQFTHILKNYKEKKKSNEFSYKEIHMHDKRLQYFPESGQQHAFICNTVDTDDTQDNLMYHYMHKENLPLHLFPSSYGYNVKKWVYRTTFKLHSHLFLNFQKETYDDDPNKTYNSIYYNHNSPSKITQDDIEQIKPM